MIRLKTKEEIEIMKEGGKRHLDILNLLKNELRPGISTLELDNMARDLIAQEGDTASFLNYTPRGVGCAYPDHICISINDEIVHGMPSSPNKKIQNGDLVSLDLGLTHKGLITDSAISIVVGSGTKEAYELLNATENALLAGIDASRSAKTIGDITEAIENYIKTTPFKPAKDLAGHGVGYAVHEEPFVSNFGKKSKEEIKNGLVIAIEPMLVVGSGDVIFDKNEYGVRTREGGLSAHFEHTVAFTEDGPIVLTA
jgi:methionyl aminopeptidase